MAVDQYTHNFKVEVNGSFMRGECEFNRDGEASFKFKEMSEPLHDLTMEFFNTLMKLIKDFHNEKRQNHAVETRIKNIIIREKKEK